VTGTDLIKPLALYFTVSQYNIFARLSLNCN